MHKRRTIRQNPSIVVTMLVTSFMVTRDKVLTCTEWEPIEKVLEDLIEKNVSAVVVVDKDNANKAVGLVTKTDLVLAYSKGISQHQKVGVIMATDIKTVSSTANRDFVAKMLERNRFHHALVVDKDGDFVGMVSAWDVAAECARDARAWPWSRSMDGKIHAH
jgi:CBS domain-containing protein